jgi:ornithine--oxo-acid transaminase
LTRPLVERYEIVHDVRGLGLMWAIELGPPGGWSVWSGIERAQPGVFAQLVTVPLFHEHRILCQVAGPRMNVIKALPALVIEEQEVRRFAAALEEVVARAEHASSAMVRLGWGIARHRISRRRSTNGAVQPADPSTSPSHLVPAGTDDQHQADT